MDKRWTDKKIINWMEQETGFRNGFVTRDDKDIPITYESIEDNGFVFALIVTDKNNFMDYYRLQ